MLNVENLPLNQRNLFKSVLRNALREMNYGWPARHIDYVSPETRRLWQILQAKADAKDWGEFNKAELQAALDALHATLYFLGPEELDTLCGHTVFEFLNVGRILFARIVRDQSLHREWVK